MDPRRRGRRHARRRALAANMFGLLTAAALLAGTVALSPVGPGWAREKLDSALGGGASPAWVSPLPGEAAIAGEQHGRWDSHLAPEGACRGSDEVTAPDGVQERAVACMLNWARRVEGLPSLPLSPLLSKAAALKARDIDRCDGFAHEACGRPANAVVAEAGYPEGGWGENL